jgi:ribosomal protein S18 acetylase RimI-like enzyme
LYDSTVLTLRRAGPADADVLSTLGRRTFTETFGHLYPSEDLGCFLDQSHSPDAYRRLAADEHYVVLLAQESNHAVGYGVAGPCGLPVPDLEPGAGEVKRLYVLASAQGLGIGTRLFERLVADLEQRGHDPLYLSVWSENLGAQRLYGRYGFVKCGEYGFPVGKQIDREFIFRRSPEAR